MLLSPKNPPLHQARPCQGNPVCLELFIPLPALLQHTIPAINMPWLFIFLGLLVFPPSSKLTPSWGCSSAFLGFPGSNQRLQPLSLPSQWELAQEELWEWGKQGWIQLELLLLAALPSLPGLECRGGFQVCEEKPCWEFQENCGIILLKEF